MYDEDIEHKGFKLGDQMEMNVLHEPIDVDLEDDPMNDIDSTDVSKKELFGWFGYGFAAEGYA